MATVPVDNSILIRNRRALALFDPRAAACVALARTGSAAASAARVAVEEAQADWLPAGLKSEDTAVLMGIGDGSRLLRLLSQTASRVLVIECELADCLAVLRAHEFSAALAAGRLRFMLVPAATAITREISLRECVAELVDRLHRSGGSLHLVAGGGAAPQSEFFNAMSQGVQDAARIGGEFARACAAAPVFDVTVVSPCCAIFDDLAQCFNRLGLRTQLLRVPDRPGVWTAESSKAALLGLASAPSRLIVTRNRSLFETDHPADPPQPEAFIPGQKVSWWWDVPNLASHIDLQHPRGNLRAFGFARDILPLLPEGAQWLPPGARSAFVEAGMQKEMEQDIAVSFVGQSRITGLHANLRHLAHTLRDLGGKAPALARDLDHARGYEALHRYLTKHYRDISEAIAGLLPAFPAHAYYLRYLLDMAATGAFRVAAIERLVRERVRIALYGDDEWLTVPGVARDIFKGVIDPAELPAVYRRSRINLNLNFMQVSSTINPKVLDIAAAGGVVLTDPRPELELLYPDPAVRPFAFHSLDQLVETIDALGQADLSRHRRALSEHTRRHHSLQQRAEWLARHFGVLAGA